MVIWGMIILVQLLLVLVIAASASASSIDTVMCHPDERDALLSFKAAFSIIHDSSYPYYCHDSDAKTETWEKNGDCCKWEGVTCDHQTGHVIELNLVYSCLNGSFPANTPLFRLSRLRYLSLYGNFLSGHVPSEIGWLSHLTTLDLSFNNYQLKMPNFETIITNLTNLEELYLDEVSIASNLHPSLFNFSKLTYIVLSDCGLSGRIPDSIFKLHNLKFLFLDGNNLTGIIPLSSIQKLQSLHGLMLSDNSFSIIDDTKFYSTPSSWPSFHVLSLSSCKLGHFPDFLRGQENLTWLELSNNDIQDSLPDWLSTLGSLQLLNISHNSIRGGLEHLPMQSMYELNIQYNLFYGALPVPFHTTTYFWASNNQFSGAIPPSLCNVSDLLLLDLAQNKLIGNIPDCFASHINNRLEVLDLRQNNLIGAISSSLFQECFNLKALSLSGNQFEGQIPQSLNNCSQLELLDLSSNSLDDIFPYWLGILPSLKVLILASNKLRGSLTAPNTMSSFPMLQILDISNNAFNGSLPPKLLMSMKAMTNIDNTLYLSYMNSAYDTYQDSIVTWIKGVTRRLDAIYDKLVLIDASRNKLEGVIPDAIGNLVSLQGLNLAHNNFTGHIPSSLSNLSLLESLDLSFNRLEGGIPFKLVNLNSLAFFNVSENNLVGPVPITKQFGTFSDPSYLGNPGLCGPWLTNKCGKLSETPLNSSSSEGSGDESISVQVWEIGLMGCGCGLLVGLALGYILFWMNSPYWLQRLIFQIEKIVIRYQSRKRQNKRR